MNRRRKQFLTMLLAGILALTGIQWPEKVSAASAYSGWAEQDTSSVDADISVSAENSFGKLFKEALESEQAEQQENNGYNIFSVEVADNTATVQMETLKDCTLVVGIYEENSNTMSASANKPVSSEDKNVTLQFNTTLPSYFSVQAFLVDDTMHPLCTVYENPNYTKEMQEFLAKTTKDFDEEKVLNLDTDNTNNFAVYGEDTKIISHNAGTNQLASSREGVYVFENIDSSVSSLQKHDIFAYEQDNGEMLLIKTGSISVTGTTATVTEEDTSMEEVFDYVKIDTQDSKGSVVVDDSTCGENVVYNGLKQKRGNRKKDISYEGSIGESQKYTLGDASLGNDTAKISGSMTLSLDCCLKLFVSKSKTYAEIRFGYVLDNNITVKVKSENDITLAKVSFSPIAGIPVVTVTVTPVFHANFNMEGKITAKVSGQVGYVVEEKKIKSLTNSPKVDLDCDIEGELYLGLSLRPVISLISEKIAMLGMTATVGAKATVNLSKPIENVRHTCKVCFEGDISFQYKLLFEAKLLDSDKLNPMYTQDGSRKITDYYFSADHMEFGLGVCPYKEFKMCVTVYDTDKKTIPDALVNNDAVTNEKGIAILFLKGGKHTITAAKDGIGKTEKNITVEKPAKIILILSEASDAAEDLDAADDGSNVYFGRYYQKKIVDKLQTESLDEVEFTDNTAVIGGVKYYKKRSGYYKETPIAWKIIDDDGAYYTLLSKKLLEWWTYSAPDNFWPKSNIRERLNNEFYNTAFSESEQADIADTEISTTEISYDDVYIDHEDNVITDTVTDKVYLLSKNDVLNPKYGFSGEQGEDSLRVAYASQYMNDDEVPARYWLLGPNYWFYGMLHGEYVSTSGEIAKHNLVNGSVSNEMGVRPVIRVKKNSASLFTKADVTQNVRKEAVIRRKASQKTFTDLQADTIYNFYAVKSRNVENVWDGGNLLYITQVRSDKAGSLNVTYDTGQKYNNIEEFVVPLQKNIAKAAVTFPTWIIYDASEHVIEPAVSYQGSSLKEGVDYEVTGDYSAADVGNYSVTINGIGDYTGFVTIPYTISQTKKPEEPGPSDKIEKPGKVTEITVRSQKRKITIQWKKRNDASGYQIQYALDKAFTKGKKVKNAKGTAKSIKIKGLKQKATYYIRVRAYKKVSGNKVYGAWSNKVKCKVK